MKCLLCKENEANKTGSHIFSHSLISKCINEIGKKGRDKEIIHSFSQSGEKSTFFGRGILSETIFHLKGRNLTEEEIDVNTNDIVVDNIYCTVCEGLFGKVETLAAKEFLQKTRDNVQLEFDCTILIRLFFYIQIWRASSYNYDNWSLRYKELEEELREIIHKGCKQIETGLDEGLQSKILSFPLIVSYLDSEEKEETTNLIQIPHSKASYLFLLCDFVVEFYPVPNKEIDVRLSYNYHGLNNDLKSSEINLNENKFVVRYINKQKRKEWNKSIWLKEYVIPEIDRVKINFIKLYWSKYNMFPPQAKVIELNDRILDWEDVPDLDKISEKRINQIIQEVLSNE